MVRKFVQLTDEQVESLERFAKKQDVPVAELIARAVDQFICAENMRDEEIRKKAMAFVGMVSDDVTDLSTNHDYYLMQAYEQQHGLQPHLEQDIQ
jgi:hypothetical protein